MLDRLRAGAAKSLRPGFESAFDRAREAIGSDTYIGPWELETLFLEYLCCDVDTSRKYLATRHWGVTAEMINWLRYIENEQSKKRDQSLILEELARIAYRQFGHQAEVPEMHSAVRWWSIVEEPQLAAQLSVIYGLDARRMRRTFIGLFAYLDGDTFRLPPSNVEESVGSRFGTERTLSRLSAPLEGLSRELSRDLTDEMAYRESPLRRHPIVRFDESRGAPAYCAPIRNLLWWRVTSGLYYDLLDVPDFQNLIGAQFEKYIAGLLRGTTGWVVRPKEMYRPSGFGNT